MVRNLITENSGSLRLFHVRHPNSQSINKPGMLIYEFTNRNVNAKWIRRVGKRDLKANL